MLRHFRYLRYLMRHKWYVMIECWKRGLIWRGITHDLSKFLPSEWGPYADYFYGPEDRRDEERFSRAWLLHQHRNDHHWQWWILRNDDHTVKTLPMSDAARREMLADWVGVARAGGKDLLRWYAENSDKMQLNRSTRAWLRRNLPASKISGDDTQDPELERSNR